MGKRVSSLRWKHPKIKRGRSGRPLNNGIRGSQVRPPDQK
jgi:hypothetical protein